MKQHPDTEALSAYLDDEAPEWAAHVAGCPECSTQLERLRVVALAVGQGVPAPNATDRERAVARALGAAQAAAPTTAFGPRRPAGSDESIPAGPERPDRVVKPGPVPLAPRPVATGASRSGRPVWVAVGSVAAAVLAAVGALSLVNRQDDASDTTTALEAPRDTEARGSPESGGAVGADGVVDGGELGELPDEDALVDRVAGAVAGADSRFSAEADTGLRGPNAVDGDSPTAAAPAPEARAPSSSPTAGVTNDAAPPADAATPRIVGTRACELQARQVDPALGRVVYAATGQEDGEPVVVLGFALTPEDAPVTGSPQAQAGRVKVMVLSQSGCRLLSQSVSR